MDLPEQPASVRVKPKPKGVAILEMNGDPTYPEILIIPEYEAQLWYLTRVEKGKWKNTLMRLPAPESRKKMDNAFLVDLDGDGDLDIATTEENGDGESSGSRTQVSNNERSFPRDPFHAFRIYVLLCLLALGFGRGQNLSAKPNRQLVRLASRQRLEPRRRSDS